MDPHANLTQFLEKRGILGGKKNPVYLKLYIEINVGVTNKVQIKKMRIKESLYPIKKFTT